VEQHISAVIGIDVDCPTCSSKFTLDKAHIRNDEAEKVHQTISQNENARSPQWRAVVQECRNYVPIIEGPSNLGAGLLVSPNGLIITNKHVVEKSPSLLVSLHDGTRAKAICVHQHQTRDLALVRAAIQTSKFFDLFNSISSCHEAGDEVLAIGHPRGLSFTSTRGIISECRRSLHDGVFVQTDVAINPGNSGGPLLDGFGKLVGINTQIRSDSQGLGFAIPSDQVFEYWEEVTKLCNSGKLRVPTDEELAAKKSELSPDQMLESAANLAGLNFAFRKDRAWDIETPTGQRFGAYIDAEYFNLVLFIAELTEEDILDSSLLLQLLRWQNEMGIVRFKIDEENSLFMDFGRSSEDLDISEVCQALLAMADAVDLYSAKLKSYLGV
jgi:S1-C subfamily serine protease